MDDLISRQAEIDAIHEDIDWLAAQGARDLDLPECMERAKSILQSLPSAQPMRKTSKWIYRNVREGPLIYRCDRCNACHRAMYDFCPSCGADMRGEQNAAN